MGYAFISYSSKNKLSAEAVCNLLKTKKIKTWMAPGDIPAGSKYAKVINRAVKECSCFLLILSEDAQNSVWVAKEVERAVNYRKPIIPVQIDNMILNDEFEMYISTDQVVSVQKIDENAEGIDKILNSVISFAGIQETDTDTQKNNVEFCLFSSEKQEKTFLMPGTNLVGTDERKARIFINDKLVSKIHAAITVAKGTASIQDLYSQYGTFVNEEKMDPSHVTIIHPDDRIKFGNQEYVLLSSISSAGQNQSEQDTIDDEIGIGYLVDGRYRITKYLGRGGISDVFEAENIRTKKKWAIKVINSINSVNRQILDKLESEATLLNSLSHPGLPTIADIIQTDNRIIIVMDNVEGESLMRIVAKEGPQDENTIIDWAKQLCKIVAYLHMQTPPVIHDDIKPENILIKSDGRLSLLDFGKALSNCLMDNSRIGTNIYASPERYQGTINERTDIFSIGITLYISATARVPRLGASDRQLTPIRQINPQISPALAYVIGKCTEADPQKRYQDAQGILADLEQIDSLPVDNKKAVEQGEEHSNDKQPEKKKRSLFSILFRK